MRRPPVRYATGSGGSIAYQVLGQGPPDLVFIPGFVSHLDLAWEEPFFARFLRGLAGFCRLMWFDRRGTGLSDPIGSEPTPIDRSGEIGAVMDMAACDRAVLFGVSEGASLAALYALRAPERVAQLVLYSGYARGLADPDRPWAWSHPFFEAMLASFEQMWESGRGIEQAHPSLVDDQRYREWLRRYLRAAASPGMARALMRSNATLDLRNQLADLQVPTLLLHRRDDRWMSIEYSRELAALIPHARLVELPGIDHWPWIGDADAVLDEIEEFVTGTRQRHDRPVAGPQALTPRELVVTRLAVQGLSAADIAARLVISVRTVESHIANSYAKLGINTRVELVRRATEFGL